MRPNWTHLIAASLIAVAVAPAFAGTDGGRISFQGAIVTPTCSVSTTRNAPAGATQRQGCANATKTGLEAQAVQVRSVHLTDRQVATLLHDFSVNQLAIVDGHARTVLVQYSYR